MDPVTIGLMILGALMGGYGLIQQNKGNKQQFELGMKGLGLQEKMQLAQTEAEKRLNTQKESMSDKYMKEAQVESMRNRSENRAMRTQENVMHSQDQQAAMMMSLMQGIQSNQPNVDMRYISQLLQ